MRTIRAVVSRVQAPCPHTDSEQREKRVSLLISMTSSTKSDARITKFAIVSFPEIYYKVWILPWSFQFAVMSMTFQTNTRDEFIRNQMNKCHVKAHLWHKSCCISWFRLWPTDAERFSHFPNISVTQKKSCVSWKVKLLPAWYIFLSFTEYVVVIGTFPLNPTQIVCLFYIKCLKK